MSRSNSSKKTSFCISQLVILMVLYVFTQAQKPIETFLIDVTTSNEALVEYSTQRVNGMYAVQYLSGL